MPSRISNSFATRTFSQQGVASSGKRTIERSLSRIGNVTGRNPLSEQPISTAGAIPDRISVGLLKRVSELDENGFHEYACRGVQVPLYDRFGEPLWVEHPKFRQVDVVALDVTTYVQGFESDT